MLKSSTICRFFGYLPNTQINVNRSMSALP